jgi:hypothetical protein
VIISGVMPTFKVALATNLPITCAASRRTSDKTSPQGVKQLTSLPQYPSYDGIDRRPNAKIFAEELFDGR